MMKELLHKITKGGILVDVHEGELQIFSTDTQVDDELVAEIKTNRSELIAYLNKQKQSSFQVVKYQQIPNCAPAESYPLSNAQLRLWLASQMEENAAAFNMHKKLVLEGNYNVSYLEQAIHAVIARHEILRTVFRLNEEGEVRQYVIPADALDFSIAYQDYRAEQDKHAAAANYISQDVQKPFDLARGPLLRAALLRLADDQYVFHYSMHHIISDEWSGDVLSRDVTGYYQAYATGTPPAMAPLRIQYKDYAAWQQEQLTLSAYQAHRDYWLNRLAGDLPVIDFPSNNLRPKVKTNTGKCLSTYLSAELTSRLEQFIKVHEGSWFMLTLAAINVLVYKYTSNRDILIGSPFGGRFHPDLENQIGFYVNSLALRNVVEPEAGFAEFYQRVKQNTLEDFTHQQYPFDKLVDDLKLEYDASRSTLFDVSLTLHKHKASAGAMEPGLIDKIEDRRGRITSKNDIEFHVIPLGNVTGFEVVFNPDVYEEKMIARMMRHFKTLLATLLSAPEQPLHAIEYLLEEEKAELVEAFNATAVDYPQEQTLIDLFGRQAQRTPDAIAVVFQEKSLTYRELDVQSNQLAHCLMEEYGVKPGDFVGIHLDRSEQYLVCLLGVLKSGGVYLPIDPGYPVERKQYMMEDAGIRLLISSTSYMFDFAYFEGALLAVDVAFTAAQYSQENPFTGQAHDLAYLIYTSGSTGNPKGVLIQHGAITNTILAQISAFGIAGHHRALQFASFSFDASISEIFIVLLAGARLFIASEAVRSDLRLLEIYLGQNDIEVATIPPSYFQLMSQESLKGLKVLITAGELPDYEKVMAYTACEGTYFNAYGPTETSICASIFKMPDPVSVESKTIPIGRPIANTEIYILDEYGQLKPPGAVGEICVGGKGLAKGYLNQPELTREKFILHPFREGKRLYRTGDLGRVLSDGSIEFKGRKDAQVKIRGYRIELGEVEAALERIENVRQAVVVATDDAGGIKQLVAYIVYQSAADPKTTQQLLEKKLPEYMVPKLYVPLAELPLTHNGKINRKALPNPDGNAYNKKEYVAPTSEVEKRLANIWQEVLGVQQVGMQDDFFELGGNSLIAIRLTGQYYQLFNKRITIRDVFDHPVLTDHADLLAASPAETYQQIHAVEEAESYPLSNAQRRIWLASQMEGGSAAYNMPNAVHLDVACDVALFQQAVHAVIARHEILRTVFRADASAEVKQFIVPVGALDFAIDVQDLEGQPAARAALEAYIAADCYKPFDLAGGPLLRASLLKLSDHSYAFYYNMHHIISDGWSSKVLSRDVMRYYEAYRKGSTPDLPDLRIQYKDYSVWQLDQSGSAAYQTNKDYWYSQLSGELPVINFPTHQTRPHLRTYAGRRIGTHLASGLAERLRAFCKERGGSFFAGLCAVCTILVHKYTGEQDIILGNPVAGRDHPDLENQIGFYVNTVALRNRVEPNADFAEFFDRLKETILVAYEHQLYPYDQLVEELGLRRDTGRNPVFDLLINYQGVSAVGLTFGYEDEVRDFGADRVKFDLEFDFTEVNGGVDFVVNYNTDVYEKDIIEQFVFHYRQLLARLLDHPSGAIGKVDFLTEDQRTRQLFAFNAPRVTYNPQQTVVDLFAKQVGATPEAVALVCEGDTMTYLELDARANQLAHHLVAHGIGQESLVPLCLERSMDMIVGIIGILKAGGTYVPVDATYPPERIKFILEDTGAGLVVTQSGLAENLAEIQPAIQTIALDELPDGYREATHGPDVLVSAQQLAYVIYTSGTTGFPKGVMITHRSLVDYVTTFNHYFGVRPTDRVLQQASIAFDTSIEEIFPVLMKGGRLCIAKNSTDFEGLVKLCEEEAITILSTHPYLIQYINENAGRTNLSLRILINGGDVLKQEYITKLPDSYQLFNTYGPTESTVCVTYGKVVKSDPVISIGSPITNKQLYILNDHLQLQPLGVAGEMYVAGAGLARGYLNQPDLTAERFISHPFEPGESMYKTGDLGRWRPDGTIEFLGRSDQQIKLLGNRIELGEIESVLNRQAGIEQVHVRLWEDKNAAAQLVAYVVCDAQLNFLMVRRTLENTLPRYMVPKGYVRLQEIPLTPNGKIDHKRLPEPDGDAFIRREYVAPATELESQLTRIWQDALGIDKIGVYDNFFDLGGNSLSAIKIIILTRKELAVNLDIKNLFNSNSIADLALHIDYSRKQEEIKLSGKIIKQLM